VQYVPHREHSVHCAGHSTVHCKDQFNTWIHWTGRYSASTCYGRWYI